MEKIGYIYKATKGQREEYGTKNVLYIVNPEKQDSILDCKKVPVNGKREAAKYCKENGIKPWNF